MTIGKTRVAHFYSVCETKDGVLCSEDAEARFALLPIMDATLNFAMFMGGGQFVAGGVLTSGMPAEQDADRVLGVRNERVQWNGQSGWVENSGAIGEGVTQDSETPPALVAVCQSGEIYVLTPEYSYMWSAHCPTVKSIEKNEYYREREDEFDIALC